MDPGELGLDRDAVRRIQDHVSEGVRNGLIPSAQLAVARHGRLAINDAYGDVTLDQRYVLQSAGRPVIAAIIWQLIDAELVRLDQPIAELIPDFGANGKTGVTLEHVLTHTAGFPFAPLGYPKMLDREKRLESFAKWRLDYEPGDRLQFHLTSAAWIIAELIERQTGMSIAAYLRKQISDPFGLTLELGVSVNRQDTIAPMTVTDRTSDDQVVDPWGPWYLDNPGILAAGEPSHSMVGTAADLALFYQAVALSGAWSDSILDEATRIRLTQVPEGEQLYGGSPIPVSMGLFVTVSGTTGGNWMPTAGSPRTWGHGGAAYQLGFLDPDSGISMACLSNGYPLSGYDYSPRGVTYLTQLANLAASLGE